MDFIAVISNGVFWLGTVFGTIVMGIISNIAYRYLDKWWANRSAARRTKYEESQLQIRARAAVLANNQPLFHEAQSLITQGVAVWIFLTVTLHFAVQSISELLRNSDFLVGISWFIVTLLWMLFSIRISRSLFRQFDTINLASELRIEKLESPAKTE